MRRDVNWMDENSRNYLLRRTLKAPQGKNALFHRSRVVAAKSSFFLSSSTRKWDAATIKIAFEGGQKEKRESEKYNIYKNKILLWRLCLWLLLILYIL